MTERENEDPYANNEALARQYNEALARPQPASASRPGRPRFGLLIFNSLTAGAATALAIGAQYQLSQLYNLVNAWFRYALLSSIALVVLSQTIEQIGIRYYFGFFYNKYLRALTLMCSSVAMVDYATFSSPVTIIAVISGAFALLSLLCCWLVQWPYE